MPHRLSLTEMVRKIRARDLSTVELLEAHLQQIEKLNPSLNAFVVQFAEPAMEHARSLQELTPSAPLHGIPVTIKDSLDVFGYPTYCGSLYRKHHVATRDSTAATRFRAAGGVLLGKTNCPEFLANYETDNRITGRTNNPWNLERTAGGSSGGESAAIAGLCSAGGIGSDGGGSVRIPAHFCGICGLKPTPGRLSAAGHFPEIGHPGGLLGVIGPMARTAEDLKVLFGVLAGYDLEDPFSSPVPIRVPELAGLRIGVFDQFYDVPVNTSAKAAVRKAARLLTDLHFSVDAFTPKGLECAPEIWWFFFTEIYAPLTRQLIATDPDKVHWTGSELVNMVPADQEISAVEVIQKLGIRDRMRTSLLRQLQDCPVLLMPVCGVEAFPHRQRTYETASAALSLREAMAPVTPFNLMGLPSIVVPMLLTPDQMPVGIQLIAAPYGEELLLETAILLEAARGPFPKPPMALQ